MCLGGFCCPGRLVADVSTQDFNIASSWIHSGDPQNSDYFSITHNVGPSSGVLLVYKPQYL